MDLDNSSTTTSKQFIRPTQVTEMAEEGQNPVIGAQGVQQALTVCGASAALRDGLIGVGLAIMADFTILSVKEVETMATNVTRLSVNQGGAQIGAVLTKKIKGLVQWCHDRQWKGQNLDANAFTQAGLMSTIKKMSVEESEDQSTPELPGSLSAVKWVSWSKKFENYLSQVKGRNQIPLLYVVRKVRGPDAPPLDTEEQRQLYSIAL